MNEDLEDKWGKDYFKRNERNFAYPTVDPVEKPEQIVLQELDPEQKKKVLEYHNHYAATRTLPHAIVDKADEDTLCEITKNWIEKYSHELSEKQKVEENEKEKSENRRKKASILKKILAASDSDEATAEIIRNMKDLELNGVLSGMLDNLESEIQSEEKQKNAIFMEFINKVNGVEVTKELVDRVKNKLKSPELNMASYSVEKRGYVHPEGCNCTYCEEGWEVDNVPLDVDGKLAKDPELDFAVNKKSDTADFSTIMNSFKCDSKKKCGQTEEPKKCEEKSTVYKGSPIPLDFDFDFTANKKKIMCVYVRIPDSLSSEKSKEYLESFKENFKNLESSLSGLCEIVYIPRRVEGKTQIEIIYV